MKLSVLRSKTEELHLDFGGDVLNIKYRPYAYTPQLEEMNAKAQKDSQSWDTLKNMVIPVLAEWDAVDDFPIATLNDKNAAYAAGTPRGLYVVNGKLQETPPEAVTETGETQECVVPITLLGLHRIPVSVLGEIVLKVGESLTPGKPKNETSEGSF